MKRLLSSLRPDEICSSVHEIDYERLKRAGYRALVFDIDNTLGEWGCRALPQETSELLHRLKMRGFALGFLSNDGGEDRHLLKTQLRSWPIVWRARKPCTGSYKTMLGLLQSPREHAAMIGDQLFTDILGAKRAGLYAILVAPVKLSSDSCWAKLRRPLERLFLRLFSGEDPAHNDADDRQKEYRKSSPPD